MQRTCSANITVAFSVLLTCTACLRGRFDLHRSDAQSAGELAAKLTAEGCVDPDVNKLQKGVVFMKCDGSLAEGQLASCNTDGQQVCVVESSFKAVNATILAADKIAYGTTVAGIAGSKRDVKACRNAAHLATYDSTYPPSNLSRQIAAAAMNAGTTDIINLGITHGLSSNAPVRLVTSGTLPAELSVGTTYYAIVASATTIQLAAAPNGTFIDFSSNGTGNHIFFDVGDGAASPFETTDDHNNGLAVYPGSSPWGASYNCDMSNFTNVSTEVVPTNTVPINGTDTFTQVWRDELTGLLFTNVLYDGAGTSTWSHAVQMCESLNGTSAGSGWRLPTFKEILQLHIDGITKLTIDGGFPTYVWSSTSVSTQTNAVWVAYLTNGIATSGVRTATSTAALCVR